MEYKLGGLVNGLKQNSLSTLSTLDFGYLVCMHVVEKGSWKDR